MGSLVVIPVCHKDVAMVHANLDRLIAFGDKSTLTALVSHDTSFMQGVDEVVAKAKAVFAHVLVCTYDALSGVHKWPTPQNWAWQQTARHIEQNVSDKFSSWFWWEADAFPLRQCPFEKIFAAHKTSKKAFSGVACSDQLTIFYMNGVGVWPSAISEYLPNSGALYVRSAPFDRVAGPEVRRTFNDISELILHEKKLFGGTQGITLDDESLNVVLFENPKAVLYHGVAGFVKRETVTQPNPTAKRKKGIHRSIVSLPSTLAPGERSLNGSTTFKHSGDLGDIVYALTVIKHLGGGTLYIEASHMTRQMLTPDKWKPIESLLLAQPYIHGVEEWKGQRVHYNLNEFRAKMAVEVKMDKFDIHKSLAQRQCEAHGVPIEVLDLAWLTVPSMNRVAKVVFSRSQRYPCHDFPWRYVYELYCSEAVFVGTADEHFRFTRQIGSITHHKTRDLLEAAQVIAGAVLFVGNQSCPYAIAEGLKQNAILEVWPEGPNCMFKRPNVWHGTAIDSEFPSLTKLTPVINIEPVVRKNERNRKTPALSR